MCRAEITTENTEYNTEGTEKNIGRDNTRKDLFIRARAFIFIHCSFVFKYITGLAIQDITYSIKGRKTYCADFACFYVRQVYIGNSHFSRKFVK